MLLIKPDGTRSEHTGANGKPLPLKEVQKLVGGYLQKIRLYPKDAGDYCGALVDEDGFLKSLPTNQEAMNEILKRAPAKVTTLTQRIVGPVVFYKAGEF